MCTIEDFSASKDLEADFLEKEHHNYHTLCPDNNEMYIQHNKEELDKAYFIITISKCNAENKLVSECESSSAIDEFVDCLDVRGWIGTNIINM